MNASCCSYTLEDTLVLSSFCVFIFFNALFRMLKILSTVLTLNEVLLPHGKRAFCFNMESLRSFKRSD